MVGRGHELLEFALFLRGIELDEDQFELGVLARGCELGDGCVGIGTAVDGDVRLERAFDGVCGHQGVQLSLEIVAFRLDEVHETMTEKNGMNQGWMVMLLVGGGFGV